MKIKRVLYVFFTFLLISSAYGDGNEVKDIVSSGNIICRIRDKDNYGFLDPNLPSTVDGSRALGYVDITKSKGEQRKKALLAALELWESFLEIKVPIIIDVWWLDPNDQNHDEQYNALCRYDGWLAATSCNSTRHYEDKNCVYSLYNQWIGKDMLNEGIYKSNEAYTSDNWKPHATMSFNGKALLDNFSHFPDDPNPMFFGYHERKVFPQTADFTVICLHELAHAFGFVAGFNSTPPQITPYDICTSNYMSTGGMLDFVPLPYDFYAAIFQPTNYGLVWNGLNCNAGRWGVNLFRKIMSPYQYDNDIQMVLMDTTQHGSPDCGTYYSYSHIYPASGNKLLMNPSLGTFDSAFDRFASPSGNEWLLDLTPSMLKDIGWEINIRPYILAQPPTTYFAPSYQGSNTQSLTVTLTNIGYEVATVNSIVLSNSGHQGASMNKSNENKDEQITLSDLHINNTVLNINNIPFTELTFSQLSASHVSLYPTDTIEFTLLYTPICESDAPGGHNPINAKILIETSDPDPRRAHIEIPIVGDTYPEPGTGPTWERCPQH